MVYFIVSALLNYMSTFADPFFLLVGACQVLSRLSRLNGQFHFDLFTGTHAKLVKKLHTCIQRGVKTSVSVPA